MYELSLLGWGKHWYQSWAMWITIIGSALGIILMLAIGYLIVTIMRSKREVVNSDEKVFLINH